MKPQEIIRTLPGAVVGLDAGDAVRADRYGRRAADLARLTALGLPVPPGVALSFACVAALAAGGPMPGLPPTLPPGTLLALRCSPEERAWGGASAMLNIGLTDATVAGLAERIGAPAAFGLYRRFIAGFAHAVHGIDPEDFDAALRRHPDDPSAQAADMLEVFQEETGEPWPASLAAQLEAAARAMARTWAGASARILRQAKGAPADAGLGLVVQRLALGLGPGTCGSGHLQAVNGRTGAPERGGGFRPQAQDAAAGPAATARPLDELPPRRWPSSKPPPPRPPGRSATPTSSSSPSRAAGPPSSTPCPSAAPAAPPCASPSTWRTPAPSPATRRFCASSRAA